MARQIRPGQLQENALYDISSSYAVTASFALNGGGGSTFPFVGDAVITGSLTVSGSNSAVNLQEVQFDTNHSASGHTTGRIYWDDNNKTFTGDMQGSDVRLQIGQEEHVYVFNNSGVTINNGDAVRISGANGANVTITKAVSSIKSFKDETEQDQILGVATEQIADNQRGYVTTFGAVRDLDTSAFSEGDILYLSATTSGSYSNIRPAAPNFEARVGVVQIANATEGVVLVRPQEPTFLTDISQVTSSGVVTDEKAYLVYDDNTDLISFTNEFSGSFSGSFQGNGSALTNLTLPNGTVTGSAQISELGFVTSSATSSFVLNSQTSSFVNNSATASFVLNSQTASMSVESASFAVTASHLLNNPPAFPFVGDAVITGSLVVSGSGINITSGSITGDGSGLTNIGSPSLNDISLGNSTVVGDGASSAASYGTVFGKSATSTGGQNVGIGSFSNVKTFGVSIGHSVVGGNNTVAIGYNAGHTSGENNVLVGYQPGTNTSGDYNISLGYLAGYDQTTGTGNITIGSGSRGIAGESNQLRIGHGIHGATISASLETGDIIFASTASAEYLSTPAGNLSSISASYALTASHALNAGGGGAGFPFTGDAVITGSLVVSASATSQSLSVQGSGSTVFDVIGSVGTLFSIDDDLNGILFTANDISGFPVLQASASGDVFIGKTPQSLYTTTVISSTTAATTHSLCILSTSSYDGAFFEYTAISQSNARAGSIMSVWNGANIVSTETTSSQIGNTTDLTTEVIISGSTARLVAYGANAGYKIKTIIKAI